MLFSSFIHFVSFILCHYSYELLIFNMNFLHYFKIAYNIILKLMKSKKNRKCFVDPSQGSKCLQKIIPGLTLFKFNLSQDNISCFMSKNRVSKGAIRKISQSSTKSYKSKSKPKSLAMKKINNIKST